MSSESKDKSASNMKLIATTSGMRISQACDRCRIKKIKCDGQTPCHNCQKISFECKTSDKLTRRAFPKGYTENLEKKLKEMEEENRLLKLKYGDLDAPRNTGTTSMNIGTPPIHTTAPVPSEPNSGTPNKSIQINNPIDQIFNLDGKGIIIGNDNLNFESQFNHLLINLNLPFLKITNSQNFLLNDPNSYLYHPSYTSYNQFHNKDLDMIYNPLTGNQQNSMNEMNLVNNALPIDVYDLFIKLINNFKKICKTKKQLDIQIAQFFLNYNIFVPIFDHKQFMESYDAFHTMYPFIFTYDDSTINGFNLSNNNDYQIVNEYLMIIIQIYAMLMMNDPTVNLNLLLNHADPNYSYDRKAHSKESTSIPNTGTPLAITSLYDFLPYFNVFHISIVKLQTYQLFLYYSLLTNNKEKSLILSSLINSFIGILGINLNSKNLFFNDLSLNVQQKRNRVKVFWVFKILLKCFNLKFGFKPSLNTTVINPVTIDRYFQLTPEKLSSLLDDENLEGSDDELFKTLLKPSIEFLNLMNIVIPSSFSPNYYQYLKQGKKKNDHRDKDHPHPKHLDWILNEDDGDGNDGNLNYNFNQFLTIDKNLSNWRNSLKSKSLNLIPLCLLMNLPNILNITSNDLYHDLKDHNSKISSGITQDGIINYYNSGLPDIHTASQLIKIQLNFHYILIRSMNYLNFIVDKELNFTYYIEISSISREVLNYFLLIFDHVKHSTEKVVESSGLFVRSAPNNIVMESLGLDVDEEGFVINDFSVKRRRTSHPHGSGGVGGGSHSIDLGKKKTNEVPISPFNCMLNGLSMTIINLKKSIVLQMVYLLICQLKFVKRNAFNLMNDSIEILNKSIDLFISLFINYKTSFNNNKNSRKAREDSLFTKLISDQLKDEILKDQEESDDDDDDNVTSNYLSIDWDDEEMDEDLKYLKILKFIKYKCSNILEQISQGSNSKDNKTNGNPNNHTNGNIKDESNSQIPMPSQVTHHHHFQEGENGTSNTRLPLPTSTSPMGNYYGTTPGSGSPMNPFHAYHKMPSIAKFDYYLGDENYQDSNKTLIQDDDELIKKEKLAINDLISLRHGSQGNLAKMYPTVTSSTTQHNWNDEASDGQN